MLRTVVLQMDGDEIAGGFHYENGFRKEGVEPHLVDLNSQTDLLVGGTKLHLTRIEDAIVVLEIRKNH